MPSTQPAPLISSIAGAQPLDLGRERPLGRDDDLVGADGVRRDQRALEHLVRDRCAGCVRSLNVPGSPSAALTTTDVRSNVEQ